MAIVYIHKDLYDEMVKRGEDVSEFVNKAVKETLEKKQKEKAEKKTLRGNES